MCVYGYGYYYIHSVRVLSCLDRIGKYPLKDTSLNGGMDQKHVPRKGISRPFLVLEKMYHFRCRNIALFCWISIGGEAYVPGTIF